MGEAQLRQPPQGRIPCHILTVSSVSFLFFHDFLLCLEGIAVNYRVQQPACGDAVWARKDVQTPNDVKSNGSCAQSTTTSHSHLSLSSVKHLYQTVFMSESGRDSVHADNGRQWPKAVQWCKSSCTGNSDGDFAACPVLTPSLVTLQCFFTETFPASYLQFEGTRPFWLLLAGYTSILYCKLHAKSSSRAT